MDHQTASLAGDAATQYQVTAAPLDGLISRSMTIIQQMMVQLQLKIMSLVTITLNTLWVTGKLVTTKVTSTSFIC